MARHATERRLGIDEAVLGYIFDFAKEITEDLEMGVKESPEIGATLNLYVVKLSSKLGAEEATRTVVREKVRYRLSDLLERLDILARAIEAAGGRRILAIVEDLDKADLHTAKQLFYDHAVSLSAPAVSIIYTFPTALRHDNDFMQVRMNFPDVSVLPNLKVQHRDGSPAVEGLACVREILTRRVESTLFDGEALDRLAKYSSGIPRELIALARLASLEARKAGRGMIDTTAVERAASNRRIDYEVLLTSAQLKLLKKVRRTKRIDNDEAHRALLHNLSVLEYRNDDVWYDVNPVIRPLLSGSK
jgi:hypothetical protein